MKLKNRHGFIMGTMTGLLAIICIIAYMNGSEQRFLISSFLLFAFSSVKLIKAFSSKGFLEEAAENVDERDLYLTRKTVIS